MLSDTAMPHGKTSDRDDGGWPKPEPAREQFQSRVYKNIFLQVYPFVSMEGTRGSLQMMLR